MRHQVRKHSFGRDRDARSALLKGLVLSLVEHERIKTTLAKAKELRRHVEKAVTLGKKANLSTRRLLISRFGSEVAAEKLIGNISKRFEKRPGGYTRILKLGLRAGDKAPMALIEFVDYALDKGSEKPTKKAKKAADKGEGSKTDVAAAGAEGVRVANKGRTQRARNVRKMRKASRRANR
jgi:large subunit ribosomal protein L17